MEITVQGIAVQLEQKKVKNINLRVKRDGSVAVSAPLWMPRHRILSFVEEKRPWIEKQQALQRERNRSFGDELCSGAPFYLFGLCYTLQVVEGGENSLKLQETQAILTLKPGASGEKVVKEWYRALLKEKIQQFLPKWEAITGLTCSGWQIKDMKTRHGTCNTATGKIWVNLQLAKKPVDCLEYLLLHELLHLKVPNHGAEFKALLQHYMPHWKEVKKRLNGKG